MQIENIEHEGHTFTFYHDGSFSGTVRIAIPGTWIQEMEEARRPVSRSNHDSFMHEISIPNEVLSKFMGRQLINFKIEMRG